MSGSFYRAFEDRYRGSRDLIRERLRIYLPYLEALLARSCAGSDPESGSTANPGAPRALDLGCGRGEWLELLAEAGFAARGVDLDEGMLAACRERGLDVVNGDAIGALRDTPADSLAVVSAFHLVEHISFEQVQELIAQALRALRPGGLLILETPNPENLVVGTSSFYDDPSHLRPLSPKLLAFAVEFGGFARHEVLRLQEDPRLLEAPPRLFDVLAGVSPDYSVVGQKSGPPDALAPFDALFATPRGIDLHALAERYQQRQDDFEARLAQASHGVAGLVERLDYHAHTVDARFDELRAALAGSPDALSQADARLEALETALKQLQASGVVVTSYLTHGQVVHNTMAGQLQQVETAVALQGERALSRLRSRIVEFEQKQEASQQENNRLAEHVAWIEGRLSHAEANASSLRHQLAEFQQQRAPLRIRLARMLLRVRQRAAATQLARRLRQRAGGGLRRLIQLVLRSPTLKRAARILVARFPGLRARLLRTLYSPAPRGVSEEAPADPLTMQMSPRSLAIYQLLQKAKNNKD